jgi:hypothetical protein
MNPTRGRFISADEINNLARLNKISGDRLMQL